MAHLKSSIKEAVSKLPKKDLEKLVLKAAQKDKHFHDYLLVNYVDKAYGEQELFEQAKSDLDKLIMKNYKGFSEQLQYAAMLAACHKRINVFDKVCKKKELELDLIIYVLQVPFSMPPDFFGTCFTQFDYRLALLLRKSISLLEKKLHEDFKIEYASILNSYLHILHQRSNHFDFIYNLPNTV